jgi:hypothetical protein
VIDRLRRLIFGAVRVREVEGPAWPDETRVSEDLEDVRRERDLLAREAIRVPAPVPALSMGSDPLGP